MGSSQKEMDQLRLIRSPNIGPVSYRQLMARFGSARAALDALPDLIRHGGSKHGVLANAQTLRESFSWFKPWAQAIFLWTMRTIIICYRISTTHRP